MTSATMCKELFVEPAAGNSEEPRSAFYKVTFFLWFPVRSYCERFTHLRGLFHIISLIHLKFFISSGEGLPSGRTRLPHSFFAKKGSLVLREGKLFHYRLKASKSARTQSRSRCSLVSQEEQQGLTNPARSSVNRESIVMKITSTRAKQVGSRERAPARSVAGLSSLAPSASPLKSPSSMDKQLSEEIEKAHAF